MDMCKAIMRCKRIVVPSAASQIALINLQSKPNVSPDKWGFRSSPQPTFPTWCHALNPLYRNWLQTFGLSKVYQCSSQHSDLFGSFCISRSRLLLGWFDFIFLSIYKLFPRTQFLSFTGNKGTPSVSMILKFLCLSYWNSPPRIITYLCVCR